MNKVENPLTLEEVKKVAELAKLDILGNEEKFHILLSDTLNYIRILKELDTENIPETYQVNGLVNVFQSGNENKATLSQEEALENAKEVIRNLIATKAVFDR